MVEVATLTRRMKVRASRSSYQAATMPRRRTSESLFVSSQGKRADMADTTIGLAVEISRIVDSPYPTSLKQLHSLCLKAPDADIDRWANAKPCQIDALAACLLEARQEWPYVIELIARFSYSRSVRDALLKQEPTLLDEVTNKATFNEGNGFDYVATAVAMLSTALPDTVPLPAASQTLFLRIFERAARQPRTESIRPAYSLLKGALSPLVGLLSTAVLSQLEDQLNTIIRSSTKGQEDHCLTLYCLSIMSVVSSASLHCSFTSSASSWTASGLLRSTEAIPASWRPDAMQAFFTGNRAPKTLQLIVLRAIWACRAAPTNDYHEMLESLKLANEILIAIPQQLRMQWVNENPSLVLKLQQKVTLLGWDSRLQMQALVFNCRLCGTDGLPETVESAIVGSILGPLEHLHPELCAGAEPALQCFVDVIDRRQDTDRAARTIAAMVEETLQQTIGADAEDVVKWATGVVAAFDELTRLVGQNDCIAQGAMNVLQTQHSRLQHLLEAVSESSKSTIAPGLDGVCPTAAMRARRSIARSICGLLLKAAISDAGTGAAVSVQTTELLIKLHTVSAEIPQPCLHLSDQMSAHRRYLHPADAMQSEIGYGLRYASMGWREALGAHFGSRAESEQAVVSRIFAEACADLESRCHSIEEPLRSEQAKSAALQAEIADLHHANTQLKDRIVEANARSQTLQTEREQCEQDLKANQQEVSCLLARVDELEHSLQTQKEELTVQMSAARRERETAELGHSAALARKQEELEDLSDQLTAMEEMVGNKEESLRAAEQEIEETRREKQGLAAEIEPLRLALTEQQAATFAVEKAKLRLSEDIHALQKQNDAVRSDLDRAEAEQHDNVTRQQQQADTDKDALRTAHERATEELRMHSEEQKERLQHQMVEMEQEARSAQEQSARELARREKRLAEYQRIVRLVDTCILDTTS